MWKLLLWKYTLKNDHQHCHSSSILLPSKESHENYIYAFYKSHSLVDHSYPLFWVFLHHGSVKCWWHKSWFFLRTGALHLSDLSRTYTLVGPREEKSLKANVVNRNPTATSFLLNKWANKTERKSRKAAFYTRWLDSAHNLQCYRQNRLLSKEKKNCCSIRMQQEEKIGSALWKLR